MDGVPKLLARLRNSNPDEDSDDEEELRLQEQEFFAKKESPAARLGQVSATSSNTKPQSNRKTVSFASKISVSTAEESVGDESPAFSEVPPETLSPRAAPLQPQTVSPDQLATYSTQQDSYDTLPPARETQSDLPTGPAATVLRTAPPRVTPKVPRVSGTPITPPSKPMVSAQSASKATLSTYAEPPSSPHPVPEPNKATTKKRSIFAERRARLKEADQESAASAAASNDQPRARIPRQIESADALFGKILANVTEKDASPTPDHIERHIPVGGFPEVLHRTERREKQKTHRTQYHHPAPAPNVRTMFHHEPTGQDEGIHEENMHRMEHMSAEEMAEAQAEIYSRLDPALIEMLRKRAAEKYGDADSKQAAPPPVVEVEQVSSAEHELNITPVPETPDVSAPANPPIEPPPLLPQRRPLPAQAWIPESKFEKEKLEWMDSVSEPVLIEPFNDAPGAGDVLAESTLRFDFKGSIVDPNQDIPTHLGLHHHGDAPDRAGYTLDELLHLSRSTVPNQRAISLRTLAAVVERGWSGNYGVGRSGAIQSYLARKNLLMNVRVAMDETHGTVVTNAIGVLVACVCGVGERTEEEVWDRMLLGRQGWRMFAVSVESREVFNARAMGVKYEKVSLENDGSLGSAMALIRRDAIDGLLSTNILTRCRYLLEWSGISAVAHRGILSFLIRVCRHSRSSAASVAECEGLVEAVRKKYIRTPWPPTSSTTTNSDRLPSSDAVKLMRLLCQSGEDVASSLVKFAVVDDVMRFVAVERSVVGEGYRDLADELQGEVWALLGVLFSYGLCGRIFDESRAVVAGWGGGVFADGEGVGVPLRAPGARGVGGKRRAGGGSGWRGGGGVAGWGRGLFDDGEVGLVRRNGVLFLRMLRSIVRSFGHLLDLAGVDDAMRPFVDLVWERWEVWSRGGRVGDKTLQEVLYQEASAALDFLVAYLGHLPSDRQSGDRIDEMMTKLIDLQPNVWEEFSSQADRAVERATSRPLSSPLKTSHACLLSKDEVPLASDFLTVSAACDSWSSLLDFVDLVAKLSPARLSIDPLILSNALQPFVTHAEGLLPRCDDPIRVFLQGKTRLLYAFTFGVHSRLAGAQPSLPLAEQLVSYALTAIADSVPGDEYLVAKLLNAIVLHDRYQAVLAGGSLDQRDDGDLPRRILQDAYDREMFDDAALSESEGMYKGEVGKCHAFMVDRGENWSGLPVRRDWVFGPLESMVEEGRKVGRTPEEGGGVVRELCGLVGRLEGLGGEGLGKGVGRCLKLARVMGVFLLPASEDGEEIFLRGDVKGEVAGSVARYVGAVEGRGEGVEEDFESALEGAGRFYRLYHDLAEQYLACSFGDRTFATCMVLPLSMHYPADYRMLFWGHLATVLKTFTFGLEDVPSMKGTETYFSPCETDVKVLTLYSRALCDGRVQKKGTEFLYWVCVGHLSGFLFRENKERLRERMRLAVEVFGGCRGEVVRDLIGCRWDGEGKRFGVVDEGTRKWRGKLLEGNGIDVVL
ncbi:RNA polymerase II associated protein 1 [Rhizophlyctis rosea]|nr:RNA polymerase II associated protein 1 [Rhizophlyctis rosea]